MIIKQISIFIENRKGRLAELTKLLADNGVNIRALSLADTANFGILRIIVEDPHKTEQILRENNITMSVNSMVSVCVNDRAGGLAEVLDLLAKENLPVEYMYAFISKVEDTAIVVMRIEEDLRAQEILKAAGYVGLEDNYI